MKNPLAVFITDTHLSEKTIEVNFQVFIQAFDLCDKLGIKELYHGGDIFTSRKGQPEIVLNAFASILRIAKERGINITAIAGNHDKTDLTSPSSYLDAFDDHSNLTVISPYGAIQYETGIIIHFLPYYDEKLTYNQYLSAIKCPNDKKNILITHIGINGILNNSEIETENELNQNLFDRFDLVLIGHFHNRSFTGKLNQIVYTGSAYQANFGENIHKGATIIYDDCSYEFVQFDFPQYNTIEIEANEINRDLLKQTKEKDSNVNVRFKIKGELEESKKSILAELQQIVGVKAEVIKEDFKEYDVNKHGIHEKQNLQMTNSDIVEMFDDWANVKKIENSKYGKELLIKEI